MIGKKYTVKYLTKDGDLCSVWTSAASKEEAIANIKREYWDINKIVLCNG